MVERRMVQAFPRYEEYIVVRDTNYGLLRVYVYYARALWNVSLV